jgi:pimeloyl-ACP methyl ester carboxylesterase
MVDLKASDGSHLKASYFAAAKPGPGVLLLHQANRERRVWDELAARLAAAGINTLTLDMRGHGESDQPTDAERKRQVGGWPGDIDTAFEYLLTQSGVMRDVIGLGGAGALGVGSAVQAGRRHPAEVKALALLSGETVQDGLQFLRDAPHLPGLFVAADDDEYPPTVEAMELLYITSTSPSKQWVHYPAAKEAPWIWYETADISKVAPTGGHGTDLFKVHPELPAIIVNWFITTLIETPGRAPADTLASAQILSQLRMPGGVAQIEQHLNKARQTDPNVQLFPEIAVSIIGNDHLRAGEPEAAVEVFKLNILAYPDSADAHEDLAEAYLSMGQNDLARQHAQKALTLLNAHKVPASSWSDTGPRRAEIRSAAQSVLTKLSVTRQ